MERLQAALAKARETRGAETTGAARPRQSQAPRLVPNESWNQLEEIELGKMRTARRRLVTLRGGGEAVPFDILRTKVLQLTKANDWTRIAVTSPSPGSGKTTTSANLAISIARQVDLRVILIDMDMRRPALAKTIGYKSAHGFDAVLDGVVTFEEQARRFGNNLAIACNQGVRKDPSDLFLRERTAEIIDEIEQAYQPDLMLFDMPPTMVNDDTSAFSRNVDCALIVAEAGVSTIDQVDLCEKELSEQTNILGVVLNKCRFNTDGYGYYNYNYGY